MENKETEGPVKEPKGRIKKRGIVLATLTIILIAVTCLFFIYSDSNNYVVKINNEKVLSEEFNMYLKLQKKDMQSKSTEDIIWDNIEETAGAPYTEVAKDLALDSLTVTKVQLQEAEKRNIKLTDEEKKKCSSWVKYILAEDKELQTFGLTEEQWIKIYEEDQIIKKLLLEMANDELTLEIANEKLTPYDARHILLLTEGKTDKEKSRVKKEAQVLLNRVLQGEDFAKLASEKSEDGGSVNNGGLYQGIAKGSFVPEFENAALSLNDGEIYPQLVESSYGYHIIKLEKKVSDTPITQLDTNIYHNAFLREWIENAEIEKGQQFILVR